MLPLREPLSFVTRDSASHVSQVSDVGTISPMARLHDRIDVALRQYTLTVVVERER
jgi:hypothetical protein